MALDEKDLNAYLERSKFTQEEVALAREAIKLMAEGSALQKEHQNILRRLHAERAKTNDQLRIELETTRELIQAEKQRNAFLGDHAQILAQNRNLRQAEGDAIRSEIRDLQTKLAQEEASENIVEGTAAKYREQIVALRQIHQVLNSNSNAHDAIERGTRGVLKTSLGISNAWTGTLTGGMVRAAATGDSMAEGFATMGRTLQDTIFSIEGLGNIAFSLLQKVQEMTFRNIKAGDTLNAQYARATGLVTENAQSTSMLSSELQRNLYATNDLYASMEEVNKIRTTLAVSSSTFVNMSERERKAMSRLGIALDKAGYGVELLGNHLDTFSIGMGMGSAQIERFTREVHAMGQQIGITASQMSRDFAPAMKVAIHYTGRETEVLNGLMRQAKATGLEMNKMLGIVAKFDTFEGAGEAVGRLNAILGGPYLNAIQMVYATEDQRLDLLRQSVSASGRSFASLAKYEQKAIMAAAGINDINTAMQLFGQSAASYNVHIEKQKSLEEAARAATPVFQQLAASAQRLAVAFQPFVNMLTAVSDFLAARIPESAGSASLALIGFIGTLKIAYVAVKRGISNTIKSKMETLGLNQALRIHQLELNRTALAWRRVGEQSSKAMNRQTSATHELGSAIRSAAPHGGSVPVPTGGGGRRGGGGGTPRAGGMSRGGIGMLAGMLTMMLAPALTSAIKDKKKRAATSGALQYGAGGAMLGAQIGSLFTPAGTAIGTAIGGVGGAAYGAYQGYTSHHRGIYGGPVPGPRGKERTIRAQGGEMVVQPEQLAALARGAGDPGIGRAVDSLKGVVGSLGEQISNLGFTVNSLLGMGKEKNDLYVTVNMDSQEVTHQVVNNLETNPIYGLAV